ncbi:MAG: type II secretion system F family protein [Nocardioides sp.]
MSATSAPDGPVALAAGLAAGLAVFLASGARRRTEGASAHACRVGPDAVPGPIGGLTTTVVVRGMVGLGLAGLSLAGLDRLAPDVAAPILAVLGLSEPAQLAPQLTASRIALAVILIAAGTSVLALVRRQKQTHQADVVADRVMEVTDLLAAELAVGLAPAHALAYAAESWPHLSPAVEADRLGVDVPDVMRVLAQQAGAEDLRLVGAAWEVAIRTGGGLAEALARIAAGIQANRRTARIVASELASARATARLVALLPGAALLMGTGDDADPVGFLLGEPWGLLCLATGLTFGIVGLWWLEALADGVRR